MQPPTAPRSLVTPASALAANTLPVGPRLLAAHWPALYLVGSAGALVPPLVAIVGTRDADPSALALARSFTLALAERDVSVLSGGALGIDAAVHSAALEGEGRTVVVMPSGLDRPYPLRHRGLYRRIVEGGGALVSPFPAHTPPAHWTFPKRNHLLAALCDLLVVVQAPLASGSLITAEAARSLGRRVLAVPTNPSDPRGGGCLALLRLGAELCATPADLIAALDAPDGPLHAKDFSSTRVPLREAPPRAPRTRTRTHARTHEAHTHAHASDARTPSREPLPPLDGDAALVYQELQPAPKHLDELALATGLTASRVRIALFTLVLGNYAIDEGDGRYRRVGSGL